MTEQLLLSFGPFTVDAESRLLRRGTDVLPIGGKAFDVLWVLAEADGALVSKDTLIERVWNGRIVNENAIEAQVHAVRRSLGADKSIIKTVASRGYRLDKNGRNPPPRSTNLGADFSTLIDRDDLLDVICRDLDENRLVSLVGPSGIGKTRLGRAVGSRLIESFDDGVWLVELAAIESSKFVAAAIAEALAITLTGIITTTALARAIDRRCCLLVLDNCEHVIDEVAIVVSALLPICPRLRILATSRETLRLYGEKVVGIPALALPLENEEAEKSLSAPAIKLFVERLLSANGSPLSSAQLPAAIEICRRLDGIPLAIEMAAATSGMVGVQVVLRQLDSSMSALGQARRSSLPRQQTMEAAIDWSYRLLNGVEQRLFRRLSVLSGPFDLEAATSISDETVETTVSLIASLVSKSLLSVSLGTSTFLMLETMRRFARSRLEATNEYAQTAARHAAFILSVFKAAEQELNTTPTTQWLSRYQPYLANLRSALDWAFSENGDAVLGAQLVVTAEPLWLHLSLVGELLQHLDRARSSRGGDPYPLDVAMNLDVSYGCSLLYIEGPTRKAVAALEQGLYSSHRLLDHDRKFRALWALCAARLNSGSNARAMQHAEEFLRHSSEHGERLEKLIAHRAMGAVEHVLGNQDASRMELETFLNGYEEPLANSPTRRFHFDQHVAGMAFYARVLWLQNETDPAMDVARAALDRALETGHVHSICHALAQAVIPLALSLEHYEEADRHIDILARNAGAHGLAIWMTWSEAYRCSVAIGTGDTRRGVRKLSALLEEHADIPFSMYQSGLMGELALGQLKSGEVVSARQTIRLAVARAKRNRECWCLPELLRIQAMAISDPAVPAQHLEVEKLLIDAESIAKTQGAVFWLSRLRSTAFRKRPDSHP